MHVNKVLAEPGKATSIYLGDNYLVLDFEVDTSHGDHGSPVHADNELILSCWTGGPGHRLKGEMRSLWGGEYDTKELLDDIQQADFLVCHNAKYELGWLQRCGMDLRDVLVFDTMLAELVLMGNLAKGDEMHLPRSVALDHCCLRRGWENKDPIVDIMIHNNLNPVYLPRPWLEGRCKQDVRTTERLFLDQRERLHSSNRLPVLLTRCLLTPVLAAVEAEGMALDRERVMEQYEEHQRRFVELSKEMDALTGGINWRSTAQAAKFIYDDLGFAELKDGRGEPKRNKGDAFTKTGKIREKRKVDQKTLDALVAKTKEQKRFVELRKELGKVAAALSKNLEFFRGVCDEYGEVFHAEFNQASTATHRLSSTGMALTFKTVTDEKGNPRKMRAQFQNLARAFKKLFRAKRTTEDGRPWLVFDPDGSQLEFRVAADLGDDEQAKADIADKDWDAHLTSAAAMSQRPYDELYALYRAGDKEVSALRTKAKSETFKPLFGGEFGTKEQMRWYEGFRKRYPGIAGTQQGWAAEVGRSKRLITPWGLRYYWPRARIDGSGRLNVKNAVYNYPIQAFATAEIIPIAMVYFWHRLRKEGLDDKCVIVNTVHDSVVCEIHPDYVDQAKAVVKRAFTTDVYRYLRGVYGYEFKVPLGVGMQAGLHWGEGEEEAYNVWPDGREERVK